MNATGNTSYQVGHRGLVARTEKDRHMGKYDIISPANLNSVLLNPFLEPDEQQAAFHALMNWDAGVRQMITDRLFKSSLQNPVLHNSLLISLFEMLASDDDPMATEILLDALPYVAHAGVYKSDEYPEEIRLYYYTTLVSRRREEDRQVWARRVPEIDGDTLVNLLFDTAAEVFRSAVNVWRLIEKLPDADRRKALVSITLGTNVKLGLEATKRLARGRTLDGSTGKLNKK